MTEDATRQKNWKRWGPYLSERQWSTVREDYSAAGTAWDYFPHDQAARRAYRWGEDGLLGITDRECRLCFALALWNERDPILKERLFGLTGGEGNHGEDVKEEYFYLESSPTHSYMKALYKYPQGEFPYARLLEENRNRGREMPEFELRDTGAFDGDRYFDVFAEYAKASPDDILIRLTLVNRSPAAARLHVLPTLWFRNTWTWASPGSQEGRPQLRAVPGHSCIQATHETLGPFTLWLEADSAGTQPALLFTDNETNTQRLWGQPNEQRYVKDAFHARLIEGQKEAVNPAQIGTKAAAHYLLELGPGETRVLRLRLCADQVHSGPSSGAATRPSGGAAGALDVEFEEIFVQRQREAAEFFSSLCPTCQDPEELNVVRQAYAGLLWSKQFYHYVVTEWLEGDHGAPPPPPERKGAHARNTEWRHLYSRDVLSMPDKWEYPWFAAWDLAFHMIPFARLDGKFAKDQLSLLLREWYMHPNGQIPAYEFAFGDVNPPVQAWAAWRVYKIADPAGQRDRDFLESVFQKLLLNFTWWVNRKDADGKNLFAGGFLGLDNIGVFDRSKPLPTGGRLQQADATAWMAFYCLTMLSMALELARDGDRIRSAYEDMASKFFEHFVQITEAMNTLGGSGLWDETDGFYYDQIQFDHAVVPLKTRSLVGLLPLIAVEVLETDTCHMLPGFAKRMDWFLKHRPEMSRHLSIDEPGRRKSYRLLAIPSREQLERVLGYLLDPEEFLSPFGIRSLSKFHGANPYEFDAGGEVHRVAYVPGESNTGLFGGNSNWRGPIWFPTNYLIIEALERYHLFYGPKFKVECPARSGQFRTLQEVARELGGRLGKLFLPDASGRRPCHGDDPRWSQDPHWRDLILFHEYFHADTGRGLGATHQTGWTALVVRLLKDVARARNANAS
ncbi:MAG TPA: glucosidase [Verrucomicrobiae bacterium]|nr:glucosidase [Verrucomicrobiae bacterium]